MNPAAPIIIKKGPKCMGMQTLFVHGPRHLHHQVRALGRDVPAAIHLATSFAYSSVEAAREAFSLHTSPSFNRLTEPDLLTPYGRFGNANTAELEAKLLHAHGLTPKDNYGSLVFGSGMAAIFAALMTATKPGDHIIFDTDLYGCTSRLAKKVLGNKYGRQVTFLTLKDSVAGDEELRRAITPATTAIYAEVETNPHLKLNDPGRLARLAHQINLEEKRSPAQKIRIILDNTFLGPLFCRPWELAQEAVPADPEICLIVESLTKIISGFGLEIGGALIAPNSLIYDTNWQEEGLIAHRDIVGGILAPAAAFSISNRSLPTYIDRAKTAEQVAQRFALFLESVRGKWVSRVTYPGLSAYPQRELAATMIKDYDGEPASGFMVGFDFQGDPLARQKAAVRYMDFIAQQGYAWNFMVSLGQVRSLTEAPAVMTHYGSNLSLFARNSVGTESPVTLINETSEAFEYAYAA